ncbi:MAG: sigma-70 family RNA polymerase sigma factor [Verrucomicrobia bacterium]|nr:sigma-70 family RNA polymerase sigma factor [Verrucomicrobiota bacterium]
MTDSQTLLDDYARTGSDAAFRELLARYVDLVYSTALRLLEGDRHRAEDVAQTVFVDLARTARTLSNKVRLGGWLHRHTCFVAANTLRGERRRHSRERQAVEMNVLHDDSGANFALMAPILDEAINELGDADRTAILLRFYEQQEFRHVGAALGSTEDAARMRVTRALEKLQELLVRRGVRTSATALSIALSAHVVQSAPAGLAIAISTAAAASAAGTPVVITSIATATKAIAMTTLQKTLVTAVIAATLASAIYEARQAARWRDRSQALHEQTGAQIRQLTDERDEAMRRLAALGAESNRAGNTAELLQLRGEMTRLRSLESDVAKLREESKRHQSQAQKAMKDLAAAQQGAFEFAVQRVTSIDALKQVGQQLRGLAAANNLAAAFTADGKLNPTLIAATHPNFDMKNVELALSDPSQLPILLQEAPETIVARTVEPVPTPDERWMRFYIQANGSVQNYSTPFSNQVFSSNWRLEYLKP